MIKKCLYLSLFVLTTLILTGCGSSNIYEYTLDETYEGFITLGTSADYAPYEWPMKVDGKQQIVGIDIEIAKEIAHALKKNLRVIDKGFDFLLEDLKNRKLDFVLAGMTPTEERKKIVDFSNIYYEATQVILIKSSQVDVYQDIADLNKSTIRIGAQLGTVQQDLAEVSFSLAQKQYIQTIPDLVMRLKDGQLDAVIMERPVGEGFVANQEGLAMSSVVITDPDGGSAVAVRKGNEALLNTINVVLEELIQSGKMDEIINEMTLKNQGK